MYKTELFTLKQKMFSSAPSEESIKEFNDLINQRYAEGWELITHSYSTPYGGSSRILVTFKMR